MVSVPPDPAMAIVTLQKVDGGSENDAAPDVADIDVVDETGDAPISW